ncbi:peptide deformylase [Spirillospora sp. CA-294931]|uniref:peptide deformylase n=1 Tax=Spirillospora sp. CA-294931 TaxID=3240042 RepID=UPI003D8C328C
MNGQARPITLVGTPVLHRPCKPVETFDDALAELAEDMFASMYAAEGVGLAANQIGVDLRVFVYDCPDADGERRRGVVANPTLVLPDLADRRLDSDDEGCLSVPGARGTLARPDRATCHGFDVKGTPVTVEGTGLLARCLQHETDHLDGRLYIDRLSTRARKKALRDYERLQEEATG